jgi:hypothetical protein
MLNEIFEFSYTQAKKHYTEAQNALVNDINLQFPSADFDTAFHTSIRALQLHIATLDLATKIQAKFLPYEKAESSLLIQFSEFPSNVVSKALSSAYVSAR